MRRAIEHHPAGAWPENQASISVTLEFDDRHRRRLRLIDDAGDAFMLDLPTATRMEDGDGLALEQGGYICVRAAEEDVLDIRCGGIADTARIAWHIGNRHIPVQVLSDGRLRIRADHVLARMLEGLGADVTSCRDKFSPEAGAYSETTEHDHPHGSASHAH